MVIHSDEQLSSEFEATRWREADVFPKFNTGHEPAGISYRRARDIAARTEMYEGTGEITLMAFACADEPDGYADALTRFQ